MRGGGADFGGRGAEITSCLAPFPPESVPKPKNWLGKKLPSLSKKLGRKKWSDIKVDVKRKVSAHRRSVGQTGSGAGVGELAPFEQRVAAVVGDRLLFGVVNISRFKSIRFKVF